MGLIEVSVIMPCYNDGQYLQDAVDSVNLEENQNTEILIIDDGSQDERTKKALAGMRHERIQVLHTAHIGPSGARNEGIRYASGTYILPLDADDRIEPSYIRKAKDKLEAEPMVGAVYCHADCFGEESGPWKLPDYSFERMLVENVVFVTSMFRKADWQRIGGFRTNMQHGLEDYDFFLSILELDKEIVQLPEVLFHYRIKKKSRTTDFISEIQTVKNTYRTIYDNHSGFYQRHAEIYAKALRDELIQQQFEKKRLIDMNKWMMRLKEIPAFVWMAKKIMGR